MNFEGLRRRGFTPERLAAAKAMHKALYRDELTLQAARDRIAGLDTNEPQCTPDVQMMLSFLDQVSAQGGIVR